MIKEIIMPKLGETMEEGVITRWFKREGESVRKGEAILEVTTDKASFEVESPDNGVLREIVRQADAAPVPVTTIVGYLADSMDASGFFMA